MKFFFTWLSEMSHLRARATAIGGSGSFLWMLERICGRGGATAWLVSPSRPRWDAPVQNMGVQVRWAPIAATRPSGAAHAHPFALSTRFVRWTLAGHVIFPTCGKEKQEDDGEWARRAVLSAPKDAAWTRRDIA